MRGIRDLLPGARRKRNPRADGPTTIVPPREGSPRDDRPREDTPAAKLDAARERLRREIPPPDDE